MYASSYKTFFLHGSTALVGPGLLVVKVSRSHTTTHHSR